jgi:hypothetical protein
MKSVMQLSDIARDKFVAPYLSKLTKCEMPDLSAEYETFESRLSRFVGGSILVTQFQPPLHGLLLMFLRRSHAVTEEYDFARKFMHDFLSNGRKWVVYFRALYHFENLAAQAHQAYKLLEQIAALQVPPINLKIVKRSTLERIYYASKHADEKLSGHVKEAAKMGRQPEDITMPLWLTNNGIETVGDGLLSYEDIVTIVKFLNDEGRQAAELPQTLAKLRDNHQIYSQNGDPTP